MMSLAEFMQKQRAAASRKEKRKAKGSWLWKKRSQMAAKQTPATLRRGGVGSRQGGPAPQAVRPIGEVLGSRSALIARLDAYWARIIKAMAARSGWVGVCRICAGLSSTPLVAYHIVPKQRGQGIRWDLENGCAACSHCNGAEMMNRSLYQDERHPLLFGDAFIRDLKDRAAKRVKFDRADLDHLLTLFKKIVSLGYRKEDLESVKVWLAAKRWTAES